MKKVSSKRPNRRTTKYVDGFVLVVPRKNVAAYRTMARKACKIWIQCGALDYKECVGDDLNPHTEGALFLTFPKMTRVKKNETIWFSYITYRSRAHRDQVNKRVMTEMEKHADKFKDIPMPFDMKRMAWGGFQVSVSN